MKTKPKPEVTMAAFAWSPITVGILAVFLSPVYAKAPSLLRVCRHARAAMRRLASRAGDVAEWNEGGYAYRASQRLKRILERIGQSGTPAPSSASRRRRPASRIIRLPCYGITVTLVRANAADRPGGGSIVSDLRVAGENIADRQYNAAIDGLEAIVLAHACAGVDVQSPAYIESIETAVEAIANHVS